MRILAALTLLLGTAMTASHADAPLSGRAIGQAVENGELPGLHSAVIQIGDTRLVDAYMLGEDEVWGRPIGMVAHGPDTLHDLRSVTKSVVGLLYGIALSEGLVPPLDAPLYAQFPEYADLLDGSGRADMRVEHALTMTLGTDWSEDVDYTNPENGEIGMEFSDDRYRFVLQRNVVAAPGTRWNYNVGATALIGGLIARGTGMPVDAFAAERLFTPLGITHFEWSAGRDGVPSAASGLRLRARDLAKIGQLVVQDGMWKGAQIVPKDWLEASFTPHTPIGGGISYGYLWYIVDATEGDIIFAAGNGGQRLQFSRKAGLLLAAYAGRYNDPEAYRTSLDLWINYAVPA
jgi:CubicO group peptidase (beta-lactamase class C family)